MEKEFSTITELPNTKVTETQLRRAHQRYMFARKYCNGGVVVELGCGGGQGLELLSEKMDRVLGCDIDDSNLELCKSTYKNHPKIEILKMDAGKLEFENENVNVIVFFEAIYYLEDVKIFFKEAYRSLSKRGHLIICTTNKDWPAFNPSPFSTQYFSVPELYQLATSYGFDVNMYASFPDVHKSLFSILTSFIKRAAVKLDFMPKTMRGKVLLKKIFQGNLVVYPKKIKHDLFDYKNPTKIPDDLRDNIHTAIFAICRKL